MHAMPYAEFMRGEMSTHVLKQIVWMTIGTLLCAHSFTQPFNFSRGNTEEEYGLTARPVPSAHAETPDEKSTTRSSYAIPAGTILPVRLNSTVSSAKSKPGQVITGRIMQDVPLSSGTRIKEGSKVLGNIVEVTRANTGKTARISLQFDKLISWRETISITTNLRAIAGFMRINEAQTPPIGPGESDVYRWLTTVQIGGDIVYGEGGPVTTANDPKEVVGEAVNGGVLSQLRANEAGKCRGAIDGNEAPQALWVFSSNACGTYGLEHISIVSAGRSGVTGVIVFSSDRENLKIPGGAGMLLRIKKMAASDPDENVRSTPSD
jgi:hypothetical protein